MSEHAVDTHSDLFEHPVAFSLFACLSASLPCHSLYACLSLSLFLSFGELCACALPSLIFLFLSFFSCLSEEKSVGDEESTDYRFDQKASAT